MAFDELVTDAPFAAGTQTDQIHQLLAVDTGEIGRTQELQLGNHGSQVGRRGGRWRLHGHGSSLALDGSGFCLALLVFLGVLAQHDAIADRQRGEHHIQAAAVLVWPRAANARPETGLFKD